MARPQLRLLGGFDLKAGPGQAVPIGLKTVRAAPDVALIHPGMRYFREIGMVK